MFKLNRMNETYETREALSAIYLDYWNNFLTVEGFAEYNDIPVDNARILITLSKYVFNQYKD